MAPAAHNIVNMSVTPLRRTYRKVSESTKPILAGYAKAGSATRSVT